MKNILKYLVFSGAILGTLNFCSADIWDGSNNPYEFTSSSLAKAENTDLSKQAQQTTLKDESNDGLLTQIAKVYGLNADDQGATNYVKFVINLTLSLLFFVCVALLIYGFYMILVSNKSEEAYKKALKIVYAAGFGIVIVGLSFFIAQIMFGLYFKAKGETARTAGSTANPTGAKEGKTNPNGGTAPSGTPGSWGTDGGPSQTKCTEENIRGFKQCMATRNDLIKCNATYGIYLKGILCFEGKASITITY